MHCLIPLDRSEFNHVDDFHFVWESVVERQLL